MILAHCPKTGGTLLREILKSELSPRGHLVEGSEACYRYARTAGAFHVSALRSPRAHVLSQFYMCRFSSWALRSRGSTTSPSLLRLEIARNYTEDYSDFADWLSHYVRPQLELAPAGRKKDEYSCYYPNNMQTRFLSCRGKVTSAHTGKERATAKLGAWNSDEPLADALESLHEIDFVAITDLFDESVCALRVKVGGGAAAALPRDCLCPSGAAAAIAPARGQFSPQFSRDHGLPAHSVAALPPPLLPLVDALTRDDARLFVAGLARLLRELAAVERAVRGRLVCDAKLRALRAELSYLPGAAAALDEFEAIR